MIGDVKEKRRPSEKYPIFPCHGNADREKEDHSTLSKKKAENYKSRALSNRLFKFNEKQGG
jgi:hypothetical protein